MEKKDLRYIEYEQLRAVISYNIAERRRIEGFVVLAVAAFYSWYFASSEKIPKELHRYALIVPIILSLLGAARWLGIQLMIFVIAKRMRQIEEEVGHVSGPNEKGSGWEHFMEKQRRGGLLSWTIGRAESWSEILVWLTLIGVSIFSWYHFAI